MMKKKADNLTKLKGFAIAKRLVKHLVLDQFLLYLQKQ
jgi:hypothetical protein